MEHFLLQVNKQYAKGNFVIFSLYTFDVKQYFERTADV